MLVILLECRLRVCMFDACAALYREVHLLYAWMVYSDGCIACSDSVRHACIAACSSIPPQNVLHFLRLRLLLLRIFERMKLWQMSSTVICIASGWR